MFHVNMIPQYHKENNSYSFISMYWHIKQDETNQDEEVKNTLGMNCRWCAMKGAVCVLAARELESANPLGVSVEVFVCCGC